MYTKPDKSTLFVFFVIRMSHIEKLTAQKYSFNLRVAQESKAHLKIQVLSGFKEDFLPKLLSGRLSLAFGPIPIVLNRD